MSLPRSEDVTPDGAPTSPVSLRPLFLHHGPDRRDYTPRSTPTRTRVPQMSDLVLVSVVSGGSRGPVRLRMEHTPGRGS